MGVLEFCREMGSQGGKQIGESRRSAICFARIVALQHDCVYLLLILTGVLFAGSSVCFVAEHAVSVVKYLVFLAKMCVARAKTRV